MSAVTYRDASEADAAALATLFRDSFCETFGHLYKPQDLAAFLAQHTEERWRDQLLDPDYAVRVAEDSGQFAGFAKLGPLKLPVTPSSKAIELRQFYVLGPWQGSGVASALMEWVADEGRRRAADELFLSVFTGNQRARRFYARHGLVEVGTHAFMVGDQADQDIIMRLTL